MSQPEHAVDLPVVDSDVGLPITAEELDRARASAKRYLDISLASLDWLCESLLSSGAVAEDVADFRVKNHPLIKERGSLIYSVASELLVSPSRALELLTDAGVFAQEN
jgi:hypothetical protein